MWFDLLASTAVISRAEESSGNPLMNLKGEGWNKRSHKSSEEWSERLMQNANPGISDPTDSEVRGNVPRHQCINGILTQTCCRRQRLRLYINHGPCSLLG